LTNEHSYLKKLKNSTLKVDLYCLGVLWWADTFESYMALHQIISYSCHVKSVT